MIDNEDSGQLSENCFNSCLVLEAAIRGENVGDIRGPVRTVLEDLDRLLCETEQTLRSGISTPHTKYDKQKVEEHTLAIRDILGVLDPRNLSFGEHPSVVESPTPVAPATSAAESGTPLPPPSFVSRAMAVVPGLSFFLKFDIPALQRLIKRAFALHELPSLVETVFLSTDADTMRCLSVDDAQAFIDAIDEALPDLPDLSLPIRKKCLRLLYRTCGHHSLIPRALIVPICYDRTGHPLYRGGFADVWKGGYSGRDVAVKVMRMYSVSDLEKITKRFCKEVMTWKTLQHPNVLPLIGVTMTEAQFAMVSEWMENGSISEFVKTNPEVDRLELLGGVARGLIYIHSQGMIHGDLKGANILIDQTGHARLADFGLLTIISDPTNLFLSSSYTQGGTVRWMSPELIDPENFGLEKFRPTKYSDGYALGMVIYETISGHLPFHQHTDWTVVKKVTAGERPPREVGFTDGLWKMLEHCWAPQPKDRPSIENVLQCLEETLDPSEPLSPWVDDGTETGSDDYDWASDSSGVPMLVDGGLYASPQSGDLGPTDSFVPGQPDVRQDWHGSWAIPRSRLSTQFSPHSPPLSLPPQPVPSEDEVNWQGPMIEFGVSQASVHHPGTPIAPRVWQPSIPQNGAVNSLLSVIGSRNLSQYDPPSFPLYISRNGCYRPPSPAPSTSITTPQPVSVAHHDELAPRPRSPLFTRDPQQSIRDGSGSMNIVETDPKAHRLMSVSGHDDCLLDTSSLTEITSEEFPSYFIAREDRLFPSYGDLPYPFPVDGHEQRRMDTQHDLLKELLDGNYVGPVRDHLTRHPWQHQIRVLDLCTGTGKWVVEMAEEFPHVKFNGIDIAPISSRYPPDNVIFEVHDVTTRTRFPDSSFDFVHARHCSLLPETDYETMLSEALRVLRPSGLILLGEWIYPPVHSSTSISPPGMTAFCQALDDSLLSVYAIPKIPLYLTEFITRLGGFDDIQSRDYHMPIGEHLIDLGVNFGDTLKVWTESAVIVLKRAGYDEDEVIRLVDGFIGDISNVPGLQVAYRVVTARRATGKTPV